MVKGKKTVLGSFIRRMLEGKRIPSYWSVSAYETYAECPTRYALSRVIQYCRQCGSHAGKSAWVCGKCDKTQPWSRSCAMSKCRGTLRKRAEKHCISCNAGPKSVPAIERGNAIHKQAEQYLLGNTRGLPDELSKFRAEFAALLRKKAPPEASWTLTVDLEPCEADDFDRAWLRVKLDTRDFDAKTKHLTIVDYKTGREKPQEHQAEVYGWVSPYFVPELKTVSAEFWWTNTGNVTNVPFKLVRGEQVPTVWTRKDLAVLESKWRRRAHTMLTDTTFAATPGNHCQRCDYRSSMVVNGVPGPCDAWKARL